MKPVQNAMNWHIAFLITLKWLLRLLVWVIRRDNQQIQIPSALHNWGRSDLRPVLHSTWTTFQTVSQSILGHSSPSQLKRRRSESKTYQLHFHKHFPEDTKSTAAPPSSGRAHAHLMNHHFPGFIDWYRSTLLSYSKHCIVTQVRSCRRGYSRQD